uniref:Uncharacterized protein n=1 Tax=Arundo donax TaxID=35708 RepID=A0A0A9EG80_ARUDO
MYPCKFLRENTILLAVNVILDEMQVGYVNWPSIGFNQDPILCHPLA